MCSAHSNKLKAKLTELAEREHRSLNKQIEFLLDRCIRDGVKDEADESRRQKVRVPSGDSFPATTFAAAAHHGSS